MSRWKMAQHKQTKGGILTDPSLLAAQKSTAEESVNSGGDDSAAAKGEGGAVVAAENDADGAEGAGEGGKERE